MAGLIKEPMGIGGLKENIIDSSSKGKHTT
jgi:hypothetical protein